MVTFQLIFKDDSSYLYQYFPNGNMAKRGGILKLDVLARTISLVEIAEDDFLRIVGREELKETQNSINELRKENGLSWLTEGELPIEKELRWYHYANHVINCIWKDFLNNNLKEEGIVAWG